MFNAAIGIVAFLATAAACAALVVYRLDLIYITYYKCDAPQPSDSRRVARHKNIAIWLARHNWPIHHPDIELALILSSLVFVGIFIGVAVAKLHK